MEDYPAIKDVIETKLYGVKSLMLKLFMLAGDHSINDMASDEDNFWKSIFEKPHFNRK